jgi:hypothetical protein
MWNLSDHEVVSLLKGKEKKTNKSKLTENDYYKVRKSTLQYSIFSVSVKFCYPLEGLRFQYGNNIRFIF